MALDQEEDPENDVGLCGIKYEKVERQYDNSERRRVYGRRGGYGWLFNRKHRSRSPHSLG